MAGRWGRPPLRAISQFSILNSQFLNPSRLERQPHFSPRVEAADEGPDIFDAGFLEQERHTGARGFVGSGAVEDDVPIARDLLLARFQSIAQPLRPLSGPWGRGGA